ncbi:MAG: hypothetical protein IMW93_05720 [Thermoanaerobacteraceae bacterium]|nr:hypothetical protein [Thermoanaerobacteraceae bacterium]
MLKRLLIASVGLAIMVGVGALVYMGMLFLSQPSAKPGLAVFRSGSPAALPVEAYTTVQQEKEYLCGDVQVVFLGNAPRELVGLDRAELEKRYPPDQGWNVQEQGRTLILHQRLEEFCPEHQNYRHLGLYEGQLAVYQGPLGHNEKLLRVEKNLPVSSLSSDLQLKLHQATEFDRQDAQIQAILRRELEFSSEQAVNALLENLDEAVGGN